MSSTIDTYAAAAAIYFTIPVTIIVILIISCFYGFRLNILDYILSFFQNLYSVIFKIKSSTEKIDSRLSLPMASLKFDYVTSRLMINGIGRVPLAVDIVCKYELPAPTWYSRNQHYDCRLSTSKNVIQLQGDKGCIFSDTNIKPESPEEYWVFFVTFK